MSPETEDTKKIAGLWPEHKICERQKCFVGHSNGASWRDEILDTCAAVLPQFDLEPWYASLYAEQYQSKGSVHFDATKSLRDKVVEMIATARYGIYDLSHWRKDESSPWQMPQNVLIELGMAIALNRPTLMLRHASNQELPLPECLQTVSHLIVPFSGKPTLKRALSERLPDWINTPPEQDWWNRYCHLGGRVCEYREAHPQAKQWGRQKLHCHISDGPEVDQEDFRIEIEEVLGRFGDVMTEYLDDLTLRQGYAFQLCSYCQAVRATPFAIYRIGPKTPVETFIAIGMSIGLEWQFGYKIPKFIFAENARSVPSLLSGYEIVEAVGSSQVKRKLMMLISSVIRQVREIAWKPRPLPFMELEMHPPQLEQISYSAASYILVVDDDPKIRTRLSHLLQAEGWQVDQAQTNDEALEFISSQSERRYSLVITDALRRPERAGESGRVGLDLIRIVNERYPELPVALVSYDNPDYLYRLAADLRVWGYINKANSDSEIVDSIQQILKGDILPNPWSRGGEPSSGKTKEAPIFNPQGNLQKPLELIVRETLRILGSDAVTLYTYDDTTDSIRYPPTMIGVMHPSGVTELSGVTKNSIVFELLNRDEPYIVEDTSADAQFKNRRFTKEEKISSLVAVPLKVDNIKVGVMFVNYRSPHHFVDEELSTISLISSQVAITIRSAQLQETANESSRTERSLDAAYTHEKDGDHAAAAKIYGEHEQWEQAALAWENADEMLRAADAWKKNGDLSRAAENFWQEGRKHERAGNVSEITISQMFEQAMLLFRDCGMVQRSEDCDHRMRYFRRQPLLKVDTLKIDDFVEDKWGKLTVVVQNIGWGYARDIRMSAEGHFETAQKQVSQSFGLAPDLPGESSWYIKPENAGAIPLHLTVVYTNARGEQMPQIMHTLEIPVRDKGDSKSSTPAEYHYHGDVVQVEPTIAPKDEAPIPTITCDNCGEVQPATAFKCPNCQVPFLN